jgi:subtilisin family serine protease
MNGHNGRARKGIRRSALIAASLFSALTHQAMAVAPSGGPQSRFTLPHVPAQLLVRPVPGVTQADVTAALAAFGPSVAAYSAAADLYVVDIASDALLEAAITSLEADPRFAFAEPNYIARALAQPNDPQFPEQWSKQNLGANGPNGVGTPGADMNLVKAWDTQSTATGVTIAIIDVGIETTHLDLVGNLLTSGKCFDSPGSARPCTNGPDDPNPADDNDYHGTLVAGAAAARGNNALGIAGTAWATNVLPLKVDLTSYAIVAAIDEAIAQHADIINMSFGGPVESAAEHEALGRAEAAGILAIAAAGNSDADNDIASDYPANDELPNVLAVAATTSEDKVAAWSEWAPFRVALAAPGDQILTTALHNSFATASGTSFAAPHVAGIAALVKAATGAADYRAVKAHLLYGGVVGVTALGPAVPGQDKEAVPGRVAAGRIDAAKALEDPPGGVLVVRSVTVDDSATGNGDGHLDPGETAQLDITLANAWLPETGVTGTLSTPDNGMLIVNDVSPVSFGSIGEDGTATAAFSVTLGGGVTGNQQLFLELDLGSAAHPSLAKRYFYLEVGTLTNGQTLSQQIGRWNWDEFQAFHVDVPSGATNLDISTSASGDLDLLVRYAHSPEYLISLGGGDFYYVDSDTQVSSGPGADESVSIPNPLPGVYDIVVVNFDQAAKTYALTASYAAPSSSGIRFSAATYSVDENAGEATVTVMRSGGIGPASIDYATADDSATAGQDYTSSSGTLSWSAGENGPKTFVIPVVDDKTTESTESVLLSLKNPNGDALGTPASATLQILDDDASGGSSAGEGGNGAGGGGDGGSSGGGGGAGPVSLLLLALLVTLRPKITELAGLTDLTRFRRRIGLMLPRTSSMKPELS